MDGFNFNASQAWQQQFQPQNAGGFESNEVSSARNQMVNELQRVSDALRNAANSFDVFSRAVSRTTTVGTSLGQTNGRANEIAAFLQSHGHLLQPAAATDAGSPVLGARGQNPAQVATAISAHSPSPPRDDADTQAKKISKRQKKLMKQARDPDAPKRPPSAYLLFQNEVRADMKERYPELAYRELLGKVAEAWKALSEEDKKVYQYKTNEEMKRWSSEKRDHEAGQSFARDSSSADEIIASSYAMPQADPGPPSQGTAVSLSNQATSSGSKEKKEKRKEKDKERDSGSAKKEKKSKH